MSSAPAAIPLTSRGHLRRDHADLTITAHLGARTVRLCLRDRGEPPVGALMLGDVSGLPEELLARLEGVAEGWGAKHPCGVAWVEVGA